jgi:quercetin 2,3-dioxygenase
MIQYRPAADRGLTQTSWLKSYHSFSFNNYHDPAHVRFGPLRVLNDDYVAGGGGFPQHSHRDMEILTWMVEGTLEHMDSTGGHGIIRPGELQRMTAGTGVFHSEFNHSQDEALRLLQIWIMPDEQGLQPGYEQKQFDSQLWHNRFYELASGPDGQGQITINQDARMFVATMETGRELRHDLAKGRGSYVFVIGGEFTVNGQSASIGDAVLLRDEAQLVVQGTTEGDVMMFDVPVGSKG